MLIYAMIKSKEIEKGWLRKTDFFKEPESLKVFVQACLLYMSFCSSLTLSCKTLSCWMRDFGWSDSVNTFIVSLLHLPYSFRILFVPWLEFVRVPIIKTWGHRKTLLLYVNIASAGCLGLMGFVGLKSLWVFLFFAMLGSILSTSAESLSSSYFSSSYDQKVRKNWIQAGQIGYAAGLWLTGTLYIYLSQLISWSNLYFLSLILMLLNCFVISGLRNCTFERITEPSLKKVYYEPAKSFYQKHKSYFAPLLIFSLFYRAPDKMIAPVLTLIMIDIFGKTWATILKTVALGGVVIGSFLWPYLSPRNVIKGLINISVVHMLNIVLLAGLLWMHVMKISVYASLIGIGVMLLFLRIARTMESAAIFSYQCSLFDSKHFNAQAALGTLADKGFGDILGAASGILCLTLGWPGFFVTSVLFVLPSWKAAKKLKAYFPSKV